MGGFLLYSLGIALIIKLSQLPHKRLDQTVKLLLFENGRRLIIFHLCFSSSWSENALTATNLMNSLHSCEYMKKPFITSSTLACRYLQLLQGFFSCFMFIHFFMFMVHQKQSFGSQGIGCILLVILHFCFFFLDRLCQFSPYRGQKEALLLKDPSSFG